MSHRLLLSILLESTLHHALALDERSRAALHPLENAVIGVEIQGLGELFLHLEDPPRVRTAPTRAPSAWLRAPLSAWLRLASGDSTITDLHLQGDTELAASVHQWLANLRPDWGEALALRLGDIPAHALTRQWHRSADTGRRLGETLRANLREYLQEESHQLPSDPLVDDWLDGVERTALDTDHLEARVQRLERALRQRDT